MTSASKWILGVLAFLHAGFLGFDLTADPPEDLDASLGLYIDEGWKTYAARNKALFGDWQPHEELSQGWTYASPLATRVWYGGFRLWGVSRASARVPNLFFSVGNLLLMYLIVRRSLSEKAALWASAVYVLDYNLLMFARIAFQETQVIFWLLAALYLWILSQKAPLLALGAAACLTAAFLSKMNALLAFPAFALSAVARLRRKEEGRAGLWLFGGLFSAFLAWQFLFALPHSRHVGRSATALAMRLDLSSLKALPGRAAIVLENGYITKNLPVFSAAALGAFLALSAWNREGLLEQVSLLWLAGALAGFALVDYRPARYFPVLGPPMILLAASAAFGRIPPPEAWRRLRLPARVAICLTLAGFGYLICFAALKLAPPPRGFVLLCAAGGAALATGTVWNLARGRFSILQRFLPAGILLAAMAFFAFPYGRWCLNRTHRLVETGRQLRNAVPEGPDLVLGGYQAVMLSLEVPHYVGDVDNPPGTTPSLSEKLRVVRPTHLVATREDFAGLDADIRSRAQPVRKLPAVPRFPDIGVWKFRGSWEDQ